VIYSKPKLIFIIRIDAGVNGQTAGSKIGVVIEGGHTHVTAAAYEADE
jgi:hypothetical protein